MAGKNHLLSCLKEDKNKAVTLNLIQGLQRVSLSLRNGVRGRSQISMTRPRITTLRGTAYEVRRWFGMTSLFYKGNSAFTLIELLVVVLIIGILAAVAVPQYKKAVLKTRFATLKPLVARIDQAADLFYTANGTWPWNNMDALDISFPFISDISCAGRSCSASVTSSIVCEMNGNAYYTSCVDNSAGISYSKYSIHRPDGSVLVGKWACCGWSVLAQQVCREALRMSSGKTYTPLLWQTTEHKCYNES